MHGLNPLIILSTLLALLAAASPITTDTDDFVKPPVNTELTEANIAELAKVNLRTFNFTIPVYRMAEDGTEIEQDGVIAFEGLQCQTSGASPLIWDILDAANKVDNGAWCVQSNVGGSRCKQHAESGTAALGICGTPWLMVRCWDIAWAARKVVNECMVGAQAGGQWYYNSSAGWLKAIIH
ncbi:hypothetical protein L873DRAFT_1800061 [Choiromyces venosus 120613-1]|uniref:Ecp2 effector protein domain-containing protein n=1 Tax=Choiromyces venosus 120613-1 TaxID=1336337 RepID=A0A3N4K070_9PEZI|nr:hypothetical protein L873DRAFT_1800061 [Choiromyces venosus 120613-1]